jgi:hypothetical protein
VPSCLIVFCSLGMIHQSLRSTERVFRAFDVVVNRDSVVFSGSLLPPSGYPHEKDILPWGWLEGLDRRNIRMASAG